MIRHLLIALALLVALALSAGSVPLDWDGASTLYMERADPVIAPGLTSLAADEVIPVMVFFTDKGIADDVQYRDALNLAMDNLAPAALARRSKSRGPENLVDFRDLPVSPDYINAVLSTGAGMRHALSWFNAVSVGATADQVVEMSALPFVRHIKPVAYARMGPEIPAEPIAPDATLISLDYGPSLAQLEQINAVAAHELGFAGQGVIVCMMDTGYRQGHDAFQPIITSGRMIAQYDFINHDNNTDYDPAQDWDSQPNHGTMTWSTLGGEASGHLYGPSFQASFVLCKTEDISSERHIEEDNWAAAAQWVDSIGASVISASLGYRWFDSGQGDYTYEQIDGNSTIVTIAADLAAYNGIAVATAMGNEGNYNGSLIAPADGDSVIACGAVDSQGILAGFSSWGPTYDSRIKPEVCARGVNTTCVSPYDIHGYTTASGTSLSTPLIGGACGVLLSAHPNWTPMMVREALMMTADRYDAPDNAYGSGIIDVGRALYYHPAGDIIIDHRPIIFALPNTPLTINASVTGGTGIDSVFLFYRAGEPGDFLSMPMTTSDGTNFTATIPGEPSGTIYYYIEVVQVGGASAYCPLGGATHAYAVTLGANSFTDSFEGGRRYWKTGGDFNFWGPTASQALTGDLSFTDSPTTQYRDNTNSYLESVFALSLAQASSATLRFNVKGALAGGDSLVVEASPDGATWSRLGAAILGSIPSFTQYTRDLSSLLGQSDVGIRFRLHSNASGRENGVYIDDVTIELSFAPEIEFSPISFYDTVYAGEELNWNLYISNLGTADLIYDCEYDPSNLTVFPDTGIASPSESDSLLVNFRSQGLPIGDWNPVVFINSNDPDEPIVLADAWITIEENAPGCVYIPGDINGVPLPNGIDVTYAVAYLKGGNPPPVTCPDCPQPHPFYAAMDVNGSCTTNGIDITYFVSYLKGGPSLLFCPTCPPAEMGLGHMKPGSAW